MKKWLFLGLISVGMSSLLQSNLYARSSSGVGAHVKELVSFTSQHSSSIKQATALFTALGVGDIILHKVLKKYPQAKYVFAPSVFGLGFLWGLWKGKASGKFGKYLMIYGSGGLLARLLLSLKDG